VPEKFDSILYVSLAFQRCNKVRRRCWNLQEIWTDVTVDTRKIDAPLHAAAVWRYKCDVMAAGLPRVHLLCVVWAIWLVCGKCSIVVDKGLSHSILPHRGGMTG